MKLRTIFILLSMIFMVSSAPVLVMDGDRVYYASNNINITSTTLSNNTILMGEPTLVDNTLKVYLFTFIGVIFLIVFSLLSFILILKYSINKVYNKNVHFKT